MRKLDKSELKRVYGAGWGRGGNPDKGESESGSEESEISENSEGSSEGTSSEV